MLYYNITNRNEKIFPKNISTSNVKNILFDACVLFVFSCYIGFWLG